MENLNIFERIVSWETYSTHIITRPLKSGSVTTLRRLVHP